MSHMQSTKCFELWGQWMDNHVLFRKILPQNVATHQNSSSEKQIRCEMSWQGLEILLEIVFVVEIIKCRGRKKTNSLEW